MDAQWFKTSWNRDVRNGPLAHLLARSLTPLNRSLAPHCLLRSLAHSLAPESWARETVDYFCPVFKVFWITVGRLKDADVLKLVETHCIPIQTYVIEVIIVANFTQYTVPFFDRCFSTIGPKAALQAISWPTIMARACWWNILLLNVLFF